MQLKTGALAPGSVHLHLHIHVHVHVQYHIPGYFQGVYISKTTPTYMYIV